MMFDPTLAHLAEEGMVFVVAIVAVIALGAITIARSKARRQPEVDVDLMARLDEIAGRLGRLETSVDAASLEIERISEGQRFTTRLLAERAAPDQIAVRGGAGSDKGVGG